MIEAAADLSVSIVLEVSVCSSSDRLNHLRSTCPVQNHTVTEWLETQSLTQLRQWTSSWLVDDKHQFLACLHWKVGSTTWQAILCNNSSPRPIKPYQRFFQLCLRKTGIKRLSEQTFSKEDIISRLLSYYKIMVVRHPLDRLVSTWIDKFQNPKEYDHTFIEKYGRELLRKYRPTLPREIQQQGYGVYFSEMIQYIVEGHKNGHWDGPYSLKCHPCELPFNRLVKLETFSEDVPSIVTNHLQGRGGTTAINRQGKGKWSKNFQKTVMNYNNISDNYFDAMKKKYALDFEQFGYGVERKQNGRTVMHCRVEMGGGRACC